MFEGESNIVGDEQVEMAVAVVVDKAATSTPAWLFVPEPASLVTSVKVPSPLLRYSRFCPKYVQKRSSNPSLL